MINTTAKNNQTLRANLGTVLPITPERIGKRPRIYQRSPTYNYLWLLTKVKTFTSGIDHTSNGYYYAVMAMRTIFYLIKGRDNPMDTYCIIFEAAI